jgi:SAM-dependent methyltransferase
MSYFYAVKNTERFSNRVDDYVKYRPHYPAEIAHYLEKEFGLNTDMLIADIGAGTGISSELFLEAGYTVLAIEPNAAMREKSVALLSQYDQFKAIDGTAESTGLPAESTDVIVAGQAFHWFDQPKTKAEFARILRPGGLVVLMWNERLTRSEFEKEYEQLIIRHSSDYQRVDHRNISFDVIRSFYSPSEVMLEIFENAQYLDFEGLLGRLTSSSYMPKNSDDGFAKMHEELQSLFEKHNRNGEVVIHYETKVYAGAF